MPRHRIRPKTGPTAKPCIDCLGGRKLHLNKNQKARWAHVEVRSTSVTMLRIREGATAFVMDHEVCEVPTNIVEVREVKAPKGSEAIRWVLYTHASVASFNDCISVIEMYEQCPVVEEFHKCLKTGLQVEGR